MTDLLAAESAHASDKAALAANCDAVQALRKELRALENAGANLRTAERQSRLRAFDLRDNEPLVCDRPAKRRRTTVADMVDTVVGNALSPPAKEEVVARKEEVVEEVAEEVAEEEAEEEPLPVEELDPSMLLHLPRALQTSFEAYACNVLADAAFIAQQSHRANIVPRDMCLANRMWGGAT